MKKFLTILLAVSLLVVLVAPAQAQVLWRSAKTMKAGTYIAMTHFYYMDMAKVWNSADEEWEDYDDTKSEWGFNTMIGYAVTDRMEIMAHIPFRSISYESEDGSVEKEASGVGDIWLKTRIGILPWAKDKHGFCVTSTLSLPTGTKYQEIALGSGRTKWALGGIFSSKWFGKYRGHIKLNYWFEEKSSKDVGDNMKLILKNDWNFSKKLMGFATYIMTKKWKDRTAPGVITPDTHKIRHIAQVGAVYKPKKGVFVRPKVAFVMGGEVGLAYTFKPMIDFWYVFSI